METLWAAAVSGLFSILALSVSLKIWFGQRDYEAKLTKDSQDYKFGLDKMLEVVKSELRGDVDTSLQGQNALLKKSLQEQAAELKLYVGESLQIQDAELRLLVDSSLQEQAARLAYLEKVKAVLITLLQKVRRAQGSFSHLAQLAQQEQSQIDDEIILSMAAKAIQELSEFLALATNHESLILPGEIEGSVRRMRQCFAFLLLNLGSKSPDQTVKAAGLQEAFSRLNREIEEFASLMRRITGVDSLTQPLMDHNGESSGDVMVAMPNKRLQRTADAAR